MNVITKIKVKKCKGEINSFTLNVCNVNNYTQIKTAKPFIIEIDSMVQLFIDLCQTRENTPICAKTCNRGFWYCNVNTIRQKANEQNINLSDLKKYYDIDTKLFFNIFGELYNLFWDNYKNFTNNNRKVEKSYF